MIKSLCAVLVLSATSLCVHADESKMTTMLITARAELPDPNFKDSIVLVMNHLGPAPAGVIINRPTRILLSEIFTENDRLKGLDDKVYFGGPVELESVSFLFRAAKAPKHAVEVVAGVYFSADLDLLSELLQRTKPTEGLRVFIGYSGWSPGQLENEIARGDWKFSHADANAIFAGKLDRPWPEPAETDSGRRVRRPMLENNPKAVASIDSSHSYESAVDAQRR